GAGRMDTAGYLLLLQSEVRLRHMYAFYNGRMDVACYMGTGCTEGRRICACYIIFSCAIREPGAAHG
ncbi:hypothetical protein KI387_026201, partial [Taxus chinensis]